MYRYKRVLVNLNLDENDAALINNAAHIAKMAQTEKLYFLFTEKKMDIPADLIQEYPQLTESLADFARERIDKAIKKVFGADSRQDITVIVQEGQILDEVLKQARINGIDLVLYGTSDANIDSVHLATKLVRKAPCSVLIIPNGQALKFENMAVALDFSEYSANAMDVALAFAKAAKADALKMINVYEVPTGFHKTGKSFEEFAEIMKGHAQKTFAQFVTGFELEEIRLEELYQLHNQTADAIAETVKNKNVDFLAVGARGRDAGAAVMLGSVSEKLIETLNIPILAAKQKGAGLGILNAIFS